MVTQDLNTPLYSNKNNNLYVKHVKHPALLNTFSLNVKFSFTSENPFSM